MYIKSKASLEAEILDEKKFSGNSSNTRLRPRLSYTSMIQIISELSNLGLVVDETRSEVGYIGESVQDPYECMLSSATDNLKFRWINLIADTIEIYVENIDPRENVSGVGKSKNHNCAPVLGGPGETLEYGVKLKVTEEINDLSEKQGLLVDTYDVVRKIYLD